MKVKLRDFDNIGDRLRYVRQLGDLTQPEMGKILHVSHKSVYHYESNKTRPSYETIISYSNFSGLPTDWFLKGELTNEKR